MLEMCQGSKGRSRTLRDVMWARVISQVVAVMNSLTTSKSNTFYFWLAHEDPRKSTREGAATLISWSVAWRRIERDEEDSHTYILVVGAIMSHTCSSSPTRTFALLWYLPTPRSMYAYSAKQFPGNYSLLSHLRYLEILKTTRNSTMFLI